MRLVAWNCNQGFDRKYPLLREFGFDVAVVCECGPATPDLGQVRSLTQVTRPAFDTAGYKKCIGVFAQDPWTVHQLPVVDDMPWLLPVRVEGPTEFTLLAHWALSPDKLEGVATYVEQTRRVIDEVVPTIDGPAVLAGDFNAGAPSGLASAARHIENAAVLEEQGLVSAYTTAHSDRDPRDEPTLYWMWDREKRYHCDHIFLPEDWTHDLSVTVGSYEEWTEARVSDHVPVVAEINLG